VLLRLKPDTKARLDALARDGGYTPSGTGVSGCISDLVNGTENAAKANPEEALGQVSRMAAGCADALFALADRLRADGELHECARLHADLVQVRDDIATVLRSALATYNERALAASAAFDDWS
jgi:hypothetical protein